MSSSSSSEVAGRPESGRAEALVERLYNSLIGGMELMTIELGRRLGLYDALRRVGPATAGDLAAAAGVAERYAHEWLEQQAVAGILDVTAHGDATSRRYVLPPDHAAVLLEEENPAYFMAAAPSLRAVTVPLPEVAQAYRTGGGVAFSDYGDDLREGIGALNRPVFTHEVAGWIAQLPDVQGRLEAGPARVLDVGCGTGWSTIALARAFPAASVMGVDLDEASVRESKRHADEAGVSDRVTFVVGDGSEIVGDGYQLACVFEALHDMGDPVGALRRIRQVLDPDGVLLVADERVADIFTAPGDEMERFMYGWSVLHCLPATMAESPVVANGTVLRASTVLRWAGEAGYRSAEIAPIDNDFWRFYRLDP